MQSCGTFWFDLSIFFGISKIPLPTIGRIMGHLCSAILFDITRVRRQTPLREVACRSTHCSFHFCKPFKVGNKKRIKKVPPERNLLISASCARASSFPLLKGRCLAAPAAPLLRFAAASRCPHTHTGRPSPGGMKARPPWAITITRSKARHQHPKKKKICHRPRRGPCAVRLPTRAIRGPAGLIASLRPRRPCSAAAAAAGGRVGAAPAPRPYLSLAFFCVLRALPRPLHGCWCTR